MSTLTSTTSINRPNLGTGDVGKSYFETDSKKILVWDGSAFIEYNKDSIVYPALANHYGIILDGTNDYLDIGVNGNIGELTSASAFSFCFWLKLHSRGNLEVVISSGTTSSDRFQFILDGGNMDIYFGSGLSIAGNTSISNNTWNHYALFKNGTNASFYINGNFENSTTSAPSTLSSNAGKNLRIGSTTIFSGYYIDGEFDEVALWGSDQSSNLSTIYTGTTPANLSGLNPDHWWRMGDGDGGIGTTVTDDGNASTLVNGTLINNTAPASLFKDLSTAPDSIYIA